MTEPVAALVPAIPDRTVVQHRNGKRSKRKAKGLSSERPGADLPAINVDWHTDGASPMPGWTEAGTKKLVQAIYDGRGSLKYAAQVCKVPFRRLVEALEAQPESDLAIRVAWAQRLWREAVYEEFQDRVVTDKSHPANIIFDLKARDTRYTPPEARGGTKVAIAIAVTDSTFRGEKGPAAIEAEVVKP